MKNFQCAYHGPSGKTDYFDISEIESFDIDYEDDFKIAESIHNNFYKKEIKKTYYKKLVSNTNVSTILSDDGVNKNILDDYNKEKISINQIIKKQPKNKSWSYRVINSKSNSATLIAQLKGEGNRMHFHPNWDEWWYIIKGSWKWIIEDREILIKKGDVVFIERNKKHKIIANSKNLSIRLAVSRSDVEHVYTLEDFKKV